MTWHIFADNWLLLRHKSHDYNQTEIEFLVMRTALIRRAGERARGQTSGDLFYHLLHWIDGFCARRRWVFFSRPELTLLACKIVFNIGTNEKFAGIQQDFTLGCLRATELFLMSCHPRLRRNAWSPPHPLLYHTWSAHQWQWHDVTYVWTYTSPQRTTRFVTNISIQCENTSKSW